MVDNRISIGYNDSMPTPAYLTGLLSAHLSQIAELAAVPGPLAPAALRIAAERIELACRSAADAMTIR